MDPLRTLFSRIVALFRTRRLDASLDDELQTHLELAIEDHIRRGIPEAEARRLALCEFGGITQIRETYRMQRGLGFLEQFRRDVRFGILQLWKSPGFALTAILTLALGIGANTTVFSMINGLLLRPLPIRDNSSLVVYGMNRGWTTPAYSFPASIFREMERHPGAFSSIFAVGQTRFQVKNGTATENVFGQYVSGSFFSALQTAPILGRVLTPQDDLKNGDPAGLAAVISETFWDTRFHRDPAIIGNRIVIDHVAFTIVGVMPRSFFGADPLQRPQIFVPLADEEVLDGERSLVKLAHHAWWLSVMGRLAPSATLKQASSEIEAASSSILHEAVPDPQWLKENRLTFFAESGSTGFSYVRLEYRKPLVAVFAMCGGILLLACLNLASLLMARGTARQRELATRSALGASRKRLIQQLLVEGLLLGIVGTFAGLAIAPAISRLLVAILLGGKKGIYLDTSLDWRVFTFAAIVAIFATLLFALIPALKSTSRNLIDRIKDGQHATLSNERHAILPRILLAAEVGIALALVVGSGLVATSLLRLYTSGEGLDPRGVEEVAFMMDDAGLKGDALISFYREMEQRLSRVPGVTSVSYQRVSLFRRGNWDEDFSDTRGTNHDLYVNAVAPAYFSTMRIPLLAGREFSWNDTRSSGLKIILNESAVRQLFPNANALGRTIRHTESPGNSAQLFEVIGVVGDAKYSDVRLPAPPTAYFSMSQQSGPNELSYSAVVRTSSATGRLAGTIREITAQLAPQVPAPEIDSLESVIDDSLGSERLMTMLAVFFAICALVVTAIGLYGTLAYATARRTTEIGIRMALGAKRSQVARMVFGQNLLVIIGGSVIGLATALITTRALASFLFNISAHDPWVIAASILALALTACAASLLPAVRAARIEPMSAIRSE